MQEIYIGHLGEFRAMKRKKTDKPGVFYRLGKRIGGNGSEKIYYVIFKKEGKLHEEKVGRQYADQMTPARASLIRSDYIEGRRKTTREKKLIDAQIKAEKKSQCTVNRLWSEYSRQRIQNKNSKTDLNRYETHVKPHFGEKETKDIFPLDVDRVRLKYLKTHSPQTTKHILALLQRLINFGFKKGLCPPLSFSIEMPRVDNVKDDSLNDEQLKSLLKAIEKDPHPQAGNIMLLALFTGMRRGSLFNLKWSDIDFERGYITLRDPKPGKDAIIPLNAQARSVLENHIRTKSAYIFPGRNGKKRTDAQRAINKIKKEAGLPKETRPLHSLRHTFASIAVSSGDIDLYTLQKLTTHKTFSMLQRYAHLADKRIRKGGEDAGRAIENAISTKTEKPKIVKLEDRQ